MQATTSAIRPGERYHYSDTGYILLGLIAEKAGGRSFEDLLKDRIFKPLGMKKSYMLYRSEPLSAADGIAPATLGGTDISGYKSLSIDWSGGGIYVSSLGSADASADSVRLMISVLTTAARRGGRGEQRKGRAAGRRPGGSRLGGCAEGPCSG